MIENSKHKLNLSSELTQNRMRSGHDSKTAREEDNKSAEAKTYCELASGAG